MGRWLFPIGCIRPYFQKGQRVVGFFKLLIIKQIPLFHILHIGIREATCLRKSFSHIKCKLFDNAISPTRFCFEHNKVATDTPVKSSISAFTFTRARPWLWRKRFFTSESHWMYSLSAIMFSLFTK